MRQLFFAQEREGVVDQEARCIEHDQHFGDKRFDHVLSGFLRDAPRDVGLVGEENLLEAAQYFDTIADAPGVPVRLRGVRSSHRSADFGWTGAVEFAQNRARRRVHGDDAGDGEFGVGGHCEEVYAGRNRRARVLSRRELPDCSCRADTPVRVLAATPPSARIGCPRDR